MRLPSAGAAALVMLGLVVLAVAEEAKKAEKAEETKKVEPKHDKELIMLEFETVADSRDKRQTIGEADLSNREVPPEYLSLLQQLQLQNGEAAPSQLDQSGLQQFYISKTPQGVIGGGPLDRSPQRFLPSPGEPRPFRPRDPVLNAISRQNSALQAEYQRKAIRDQETVFLMPRGPVGTDPPRAGPLALAGLYRPGSQPPQPSPGVPVAPGQSVGLAQSQGPPQGLPAFNSHDARLRAALQGAEVIQSPQPQYISPQYVQQLQARGLAALSNGPASELGLVRDAAQQLQVRQPQQLQPVPRPQPQPQPRLQPQPQPQQILNYQELSPAELRFVQRQQEQATAQGPGPRYVLQPNPQQLQAQIAAQQAAQEQLQSEQQNAQAEEQYLRETTPGGPPPLPVQPVRAAPQQLQLQQQPQQLQHVLQPSPLYLQQVQQLAEQQALARQQLAAQHQLAAQQQQPSEDVQYIRQPQLQQQLQPQLQRYAAAAPARPAPSPQPSATTPRSSIYVSTATANPKPRPQSQPTPLRSRPVSFEQLLSAGEQEDTKAVQVVRLPASPKTLTQAELQQLLDAGFDVSPVPEQRDPTASAYYRSSAAGDYQQPQQQPQRFAPIVVPEDPSLGVGPAPRLSARQRQALLQAQEDAYIQAAQAAQARGARLGSSGN